MLFLYQYRYDSSHLIPSNGPEVFVFLKTKFRFDMSIRTIRSRLYIAVSIFFLTISFTIKTCIFSYKSRWKLNFLATVLKS